MLRYLRLYLCFLRFSFSRAMEFRVDFFFRIVMDCAFYAVHILFFSVIYQHIAAIGGWSFPQALVFISGVFFVDALHMTVFSNNMWWFPFLVNKGDLDYYLVRPVSSLFFVSLRDFAANSFVNLLIAGGILAWSLASYPGELGAGRVALYVLLLFGGAFLYWMIYMCFLIPVFWIHSIQGLRQLFFAAERFTERPHQVFTGWVRHVLVSLLPFAVIASVPAHVLFEGASWQRLLHVAAVLVGAFVVLFSFWKIAIRNYASASS